MIWGFPYFRKHPCGACAKILPQKFLEVLSDGDRARWDITRPAASWLFDWNALEFLHIFIGFHMGILREAWCWITLQGTNISPKNGILKMIFLFPRWDTLIPWRVIGFLRLCWFLRLQNRTQKFATDDVGRSEQFSRATSSGQQLDKTHRVKLPAYCHHILSAKQNNCLLKLGERWLDSIYTLYVYPPGN